MVNKRLYLMIVFTFLPVFLGSLLVSAQAAESPFVVAAVGDGATDTNAARAVSDMLVSWKPNLFIYLGDVYDKGTPEEFLKNYGTNTYFGRLKAVTKPVLGNREYETPGAAGYFGYWKNIPPYYSYDANGWHFVALDSNTNAAVGSAQYKWLAEDLSVNRTDCLIASFHHPVFNVGESGTSESMRDALSLLSQSGVDIVLVGHNHNYQRWRPLDQRGRLAAKGGITQFVVGSGGQGVYDMKTTDSRLAKVYDTAPNGYGALRLELNAHDAVFQYINSQGAVLDSGTIQCSSTVRRFLYLPLIH